MMLSIQLSPEEQTLLENVARRTGRQQNELLRQAVRELCQKMLRQEEAATPYALGKDLFEAGSLAQAPGDPLKRAIWKKLHEKHQRSLG